MQNSPNAKSALTWTSHAVHLVDLVVDTAYDPPLRLIRTKVGSTTGNVAIVAAGDPDTAVQIFAIDDDHPIENIAVKKVLSTGTTAADLVGGY